MIIVYGSEMCPDCRACKANFDRFGIEYEYRDVCKDLKHLKAFLILRDGNPVFDRLKAIHDIGLPGCVAPDGRVFTDWEGYLKGLGFEPFWPKEGEGAACSLDHRGC